MVNGETLRALRLRAGLTVKALSEKAGLSEATIDVIEAGKRDRLNDATLIALSKGLELDPVDLERRLKEPTVRTA